MTMLLVCVFVPNIDRREQRRQRALHCTNCARNRIYRGNNIFIGHIDPSSPFWMSVFTERSRGTRNDEPHRSTSCADHHISNTGNGSVLTKRSSGTFNDDIDPTMWATTGTKITNSCYLFIFACSTRGTCDDRSTPIVWTAQWVHITVGSRRQVTNACDGKWHDMKHLPRCEMGERFGDLSPIDVWSSITDARYFQPHPPPGDGDGVGDFGGLQPHPPPAGSCGGGPGMGGFSCTPALQLMNTPALASM